MNSPGRDKRQAAERRGRRAELVAAIILRTKGYQVLARRVRLPVGEIDIVARRGDTLAFIEVKQRHRREDAVSAVREQNWQRIARAAENWASRRPDARTLNWRYDLVTVSPWVWPKHYKDFWRP